MDGEDDIQYLIDEDQEIYHAGQNQSQGLEVEFDHLQLDDGYHQVIYGYRKSRWRTVLVYLFSILTICIPFLLFYWVPRWKLYVTCVRCSFQSADCVLIIETYQKKYKEHYIKRVLLKNIADTSGLFNEGYQPDHNEKAEYLDKAENVLAPIYLEDGSILNINYFRYLRFKKQTLLWDSNRAKWMKLAGVESGTTCVQMHSMAAKLPSPDRRSRMLNIYGLNEIKVPVQTVMTLIILEVFNPFYMFQLFSVVVWLFENYYYYCIAIVIMSVFGVTTSVIQTRKNQLCLRATVEAHDTVQLADGRTVDSRFIAPGDVIVLPAQGCLMLCDAALVTGSAIVNESMLTGESVPVTKSALLRTDTRFDMREHSSSILFCGTTVIQTRYYNNEPVKAVVLRTGYDTTKGQLVRSILYPIPADFKFDRDSYKYILILSALAAIGLAYTVALKWRRAMTPGDIAIKALDIITIVIPPALPAAMTVGRLYAINRLKKAHIACLNTRAVNVSGSLDCICFDKTGTLTEDGLDMWGVVPVSSATVPSLLGRSIKDARTMPDLHHLKLAMATCHSLTVIDGVLAGDPLDLKMFEATGWSLEEPDVPENSNYEILTPTIVRPPKPVILDVDNVHMPLEVGLVQSYQFVSSLQRSSVVCRVLGEDVFRVYCKGAPEMLKTLCKPETVPANLMEVLTSYAEKGYRVIAQSTRVMEVKYKELQKMTREEVECELEFLGLVILENRLKPATTAIIRELKEANIQVVMITGDNVHTAVSVAKECGILAAGERVVHLHAENEVIYCESTLHGSPVGSKTQLQGSWRSIDSGRGTWRDSASTGHHSQSTAGRDAEVPAALPNYKIVCTGDTWKVLREHHPDMVGRVIERGAVFARMTSDQKQQLIVEYQALGYYVGMCGDGANDCGALKAAHTGISLSQLESSVAAPFTSQHPDIVCVERILREGRAALTTSFGLFKFMVGYSLTQFFSTAFLYYFDSNLTDFQFLYIDLVLLVNFAFFFGLTEAYTGKLCKIPPLNSLLGIVPTVSLISQLLLIASAQFVCYYCLTLYPWYVPHQFISNDEYECWENYAVFTVSSFQYIIMVIVFSHGAPYRKSVVTNYWLMLSLCLMTALNVYVTLAPAEWFRSLLELRLPLSKSMRYIILAIASFQFLIALFFERFIIQYVMESKEMIPRCIKEKRVRKTKHLMLKRLLTNNDYLSCDTSFDFETENTSRSS